MVYSPLSPQHLDYPSLAPLVDAILVAGGGLPELEARLPIIFRTAIDEVIDAPRTGRFLLSETEKTEKTYLGTKVEILVRSYLEFPKGRALDMSVDGTDVDIKNTMGANWSIPRENVGRPALLIRTSEQKARCDVGISILRDEYLRPKGNQDQKRGILAAAMENIWWLLHDHPYPVNFWQLLSPSDRNAIMDAGGGTRRIAALFELIQRRPISRTQIQALGQQHDYMRRVRRGGGARDILAPKGIAILWGGDDRDTIRKLGLGLVTQEEFISYYPTDKGEIEMLRAAGHID